MKTKDIELGYISLIDYTPTTKLTPDWMNEDLCPGEEPCIPVNPDEVVLEKGDYTLCITYPLQNPYKEKVKVGVKGLTRRKLVDKIHSAYVKIYASEEDPGNIPGMLNRATSEGKYGIWGHCLGDLQLGSAHIDKKKVITLGVDS